MTKNFLESLDLNESIYSEGNLIAVCGKGRIDSGFVGNFILADFVKRFVLPSSSPLTLTLTSGVTGGEDDGGNAKIVLVTTLHSQLHWNAVASKLGWNFKSLKDKGQLFVIDLLEDGFRSQSQSAQHQHFQHLDLNALYDQISDSLSASQSPSHRSLIFIEDLSALLYQNQDGDGEKRVIEFLLKLKALAQKPTLITSVSVDVDSSSSGSGSEGSMAIDNEGSRLASLVSTVLADVNLQVSPLVTGFSPHISGHLAVKWKQHQGKKMLRRFQYKLDDRSVALTPMAFN